ncbi:MAG TPA: hypothetical protein PLL20_20105 [Phycisphaerae bacterium]|nr:hypothetical protein [Phycisphaerae bacterium]
MRTTNLRTLAVVLICCCPAPAACAAEAVDVGSRLELFVDGRLIDKVDGARLQLNRPVPREVVFRFDAPWEGGQSGYVTMLQDGDVYRMYYRGGGDLGREYTCLAESKDGITWARPRLGLFPVDGSKANNVVWTGEKKAYWESHNFSPFKDTNPSALPAQRYKAVTLGRATPPGEKDDRKVLFAFASPDGVHWKRLGARPIITEGSFDSHNCAFWDSNREEYVCYLRQGIKGKRGVCRATSKDFTNWTQPVPLDYGDAPLEHFYTNGVVPYFRAEHIYLGFPMRFVPPQERSTVGFDNRKTDGLSDAVFMAGRDGLHFDRLFMEAFIRPGLDPENWGGAHGNSTPAWGILQTGPAEMSIYWTEHYENYPENTGRIPQIRRGTMRLDGFVSVNAPYEGGEFVTKPLVFEGSKLVLNMSTSAVGSVKVGIEDADGQPIPGLGLNDAVEIWGDEIERIVNWKGGPDVSRLAGKPVRLRFVMKDADLYSIRFRS